MGSKLLSSQNSTSNLFKLKKVNQLFTKKNIFKASWLLLFLFFSNISFGNTFFENIYIAFKKECKIQVENTLGISISNSVFKINSTPVAATCDGTINSYALDWSQIGWVNPDATTPFPYTQTFTNVISSGVDMTVTVHKQPATSNGNNLANPGCDVDQCNFATEVTTYMPSGEVLRLFKQNNAEIDSVSITFSEPILIDNFMTGGERPPVAGDFGVSQVTFWDGPNGSGNRVSANDCSWADVGASEIITVENPLSTTAPINILNGTTSGGVDMGQHTAQFFNGSFYAFGEETGVRPWTVFNMDSVYVQSIKWYTYASTTNDPATTVANIRTSGNLSAYISSFNFMKCEPIPPSCPFTCETGEMKLDFADAGWNGGAGWTDHDQTNPQTYMNFDGQGNNVTATFSGNAPSGGQPGPNVYSGNPQGCSEALRLTASNLSTSVAEFPTETFTFDNPIDYHKLYVGGMEQRNASGRAEVSVVSFSNNGTLIDPSGFTFIPLVAADVDYQIFNNEIYVYGTTENSDGLLSIETNGIAVDEIKWAIGEITGNTVTPDMYTFTGGASSQWISPFCYTPIPVICEVNLSYTQSSCTDNTDGTFTATYDLNLSWSNPPNTGDLTLTHFGDGTLNTTTVSAATIAGGNNTTLAAALTVPADGNGNTGVLAAFDDELTCKDSIGFKAPLPCPNDVTPCASTAGCLGGNVFEDYNCNGVDDTNEPGVQGIEVQIYDCNNNLVGTGYSDSDGDWQVCGLTNGAAYRVEFILPEAVSCWATPTHVGADNMSDIQFLTAPACTQFSVSNSSDYCQSNPDVITTCFVQGDQTNNLDVLVGLPYNLWENTQPVSSENKHEALSNQIGTTLGLAYHKQSDNLFAAAFQKRHTGYANGTTGTIYRIENPTDNLNGDTDGGVAPQVFVDLNTLFGSNILGDNPHPNGGNFTEDFDSYDKAGKIAFGDLDISENGQTLWAINLNDRSLYKIPLGSDLNNPTAPTMAAQIDIYPLYNLYDCNEDGQNDGINDVDFRPFALKVYKGKLYIGAVCSAESTITPADTDGDETKLRGLVFEFDPTSTIFQKVLDFPLNFPRGCGANLNGCTGQANWRPWSPELPRGFFNGEFQANFAGAPKIVHYSQPILTDIEFTEDETMILGFRDRFGDQMAGGQGSLSPPPSSGTDDDIYVADAVGDIVRATGNPSIGWSFSFTEASNGSEYFGGDDYSPNGTTQHDETSMGGLAILKGTNQVAYTVLDPESFQSGGIDWVTTSMPTTQPDGIYTIYMESNSSTFFGKANGLGELELLCDPAPLEIGNYVWCDSLRNGIQDACERGINDIIVQLYDRNGNLVGQDTTSNSGQYYFNENNVDSTGITVDGSGIATPASGSFTGMSFNTQYFIVFGGGQFATDEFTVGSDTYGITPIANAGSNDNIDSDVDGNNLSTALNDMPAGLPFIDMTTSTTGCGDHKYDLGLTCCPSNICLDQHLMMPTGDIFQMTWNQALNGWTAPPTDPAMYPFTQTLTIPGSTITVDVTLSHRPRNDNGETTFSNYACPTVCPQSINDVDFNPLLGQDTVFRYFKEPANNPVTMTMVFSEPILAYELATGNPAGNTGAVILGAWNGAVGVDGTQNLDPMGASRVLPNPTEHPDPGVGFFDSETDDPNLEPTVNPFNHDDMATYPWGTSGDVTVSAPAPMNYMALYPSNGDAGDPIIGQEDGYYYNLTENTRREWLVVDYAGAQIQGISWQLFRNTAAFTADLKAGTVTFADLLNNPESGNRSAYMSPFQFQSTCPDQTYTVCEEGTNSVDLVVDPAITTDVIWYNEANVQVGTGNTLTVDINTDGVADGSEIFSYTGTDVATGCVGASCCPIVVTTELCNVCNLTVTPTQTACTDNADGTFTATYDLLVNWENPPTTGDITLTHFGDGILNTSTISAATISSGSSTTLSGALIIPADGNGGTGILAAFDDDLICKDSISIKAPAPCPDDVDPCSGASGCLGGNAFNDFNCNGIDDSEPGVQGVQVEIYDCTNMLVGTTYTDIDGDWQLCNLTNQEAYRVEFILPESIACWATPTHNGSDNGTNVQFLTAPACTQFSLSNPGDYCQIDVNLASSCFVSGDQINGPNSNLETMIAFPYDAMGPVSASTAPEHVAVANETGSTFGLAYHKQTQTLLAASYYKYYTGFGPAGQDAIYALEPGADAIPGTSDDVVSTFIEFDNIFGTNSTGPDIFAAPYETNGDSTLNGKASFGDIDFSNDNSELYVMNLGDRSIYTIPVSGSPIVPNTAAIRVSPPFPESSDCNAVLRPFAIEVAPDGKVYVGAVCENLSRRIYVWGFDPINNQWDAEPSLNNIFTHYTGWCCWGSWDNTNFSRGALFTGLEIDAEGDLTIALRHRETDTRLERNVGDIFKACKNNDGIWIMESNAVCGDLTGSRPDVNQGPNRGEFYDDSSADGSEVSIMGGLTLLRGRGDVVATFDDAFQTYTLGAAWFDLTTGNKTRAYEAGRVVPLEPNEINGKQASLGELEAYCDPAPLEIGNYIWCDLLENGIQDGCEKGIDGILVQLYDRNGILVGQDTSAASGQYYFNENNVDTTGIAIDGSGIASPNSGNFTGMSYNTQYFIVFGNNQFVGDTYIVGSDSYVISPMNDAGSNDNIDSDVDGTNLTSGSLGNRPDGFPFINLTTNAQGCGNHNFDLGLNCYPAPLFSLGNRVFFDEDNSGDQNGAEAGIDGVQLQLLNADGTVYDSDPSTAGTQALIVTTANDGYYRFDDLPVGNYIVEILATNFDQGNPLAQAQSSTGANQEATPNSNGDINDNGLDTPVNNAIRSGVISLFPDEPITETDEPGTYGAGSTTGTAAANELSNLTVDFGFSPIDADYANPIPGFPPCPEQPCHIVNDDLKMGDMISSEAPDDMGTDDADGTVFPNNLRAGTTIRVRTTITNNTGNDAYLYAWVDWNDDDDFDDAGENFIAATYPAAMFSGMYEVSNSVFIPSTVSTTDQIAMRFRLSSDQTATSSPCGSSTCAADGEIEDYVIQLECPQTICLPSNIQIISN